MVDNNESVDTKEGTIKTMTLKIPIKTTKANLVEVIKSKDDHIAELEESWANERHEMGQIIAELTRCQSERDRYSQTVETLLEYIKENQ